MWPLVAAIAFLMVALSSG
nr:kallikrein-related peptidase 13 splice variant 2 [Canis lupus familiaris]